MSENWGVGLHKFQCTCTTVAWSVSNNTFVNVNKWIYCCKIEDINADNGLNIFLFYVCMLHVTN